MTNPFGIHYLWRDLQKARAEDPEYPYLTPREMGYPKRWLYVWVLNAWESDAVMPARQLVVWLKFWRRGAVDPGWQISMTYTHEPSR